MYFKAFTAVFFLAVFQTISAEDKNMFSCANPSRNYTVYKTSEPIKIDGIPDEKAWASAAESPNFAELEKGTPLPFPMGAKMLWDDKYLYVLFTVKEPNIKASNILRDFPMAGKFLPEAFLIKNHPNIGRNPYTEDSVKIFMDPDGDGRNYVEMHVNPLNTVCDKWQDMPWRPEVCARMGIEMLQEVKIHPLWNCPGMKTAVHLNGSLNDPYDIDDSWTVEIAIPFDSLKELAPKMSFPPKDGDTWRMCLAGMRYKDAYFPSYDVSWPQLGEANIHCPDRWGYVHFSTQAGKDSGHPEIVLPEFKAQAQKAPAEIASLSKGNFTWKALWTTQVKTIEDADSLIKLAKEINCNVLIVPAVSLGKAAYDSKFLEPEKNLQKGTFSYLIEMAHKNNIQIYAWMVNLRVSKGFADEHPDLLQKMRPWEDESASKPRVNPDRDNAHSGSWLCPDRGLGDYEKNVIEDLFFCNPDLDGLALDYTGYKNYYGCFCDYSIRKRQEFADEHPELSIKDIMKEFSEQSLLDYTAQVRENMESNGIKAKLAIHIYPDFDLNPDYAARLPVDYCGETIAGFYKPFWSNGKVYDLCMKYKNANSSTDTRSRIVRFMDKYMPFSSHVLPEKKNKFVPFIGVYPSMPKTPEQMRTEIRIAGLAGNGTIMLSSSAVFMKMPELRKVVSEELAPAVEKTP